MITPQIILLALVLAFIASGDPCNLSSLKGIASGVVTLGAPTASTAQTSYSVSLTSFSLGSQASVHSAFAIAGFQASSNQQFFSLVVDNIIFSNGNTQMNFTMNYLNPRQTYQTTWSTVKLSWVAVSTAFATVTGSGLGSYIWAGSVGMAAPFTNGITGPIIPNSLWSAITSVMTMTPECGYINTSPPTFDVSCYGAADPRFITHLYIMGFQFDPSGTYSLAASVLRNTGTNIFTDVNEALSSTDFVTRLIGSGSTTELTGPRILINTIGTQLQYIKIGIVMTTILDWTNYPTNNPANFQYSGVYMNYTLFNSAQPIIKDRQIANGGTNGQNFNYFSQLNTKYSIFGLSSFYIHKLPSSVTVINYNLEVSGVTSTVLLQTDSPNYLAGAVISSDQWNAVIASCYPTTTNKLNIKKKHFKATPYICNTQQNIYQISSALDFSYFAVGSYDAANPLSSTVLFTNMIQLDNIVPNMVYLIDFNIIHYTPSRLPIVSGSTSFQYSYSLKVDGNQVLTGTVIINPATQVTSPNIDPVSYLFTSTEPTIEILINMPRGIDFTNTPNPPVVGGVAFSLDRIISTSLKVTQYSTAYDPSTDCCVSTCPSHSGVNFDKSGVIPVCVACTGGLVYNSAKTSCECKVGYYPVTQPITNQTQCFPCLANLCQSCSPSNPSVCTACAQGASFNSYGVCV